MTNRPFLFPVRTLPGFKAILLGLLVILIAGALTGCFPVATPAATETFPPPPPPTETVAPPPTATNTALPTDTPTEAPTATATLVPTATATPVPPLAVVQNGVTAWCVSFKDPNPLGGTSDAPSYARMGKLVKGHLNLNVARGSCTFVFAFNQPLPAGAELQVLDANSNKAWAKAALAPVGSDPDRGYALLTQPAVNDTAYWQITYPFALVTSDGAVLWKDDVVLYRNSPGLCWEGSTPDPVTLFCPKRDTDFIPNYTPPAPGK
jgi:hypothetical protein